jgi:hypothetical protein
MVSMRASEWLGESPSHFIAASAGVGTGNILTSYISSVLPGVDARIIQAIAGALIVKYGHKAHALVSSYGRGMLYQIAGSLIGGAIGGAGGALFSGGPSMGTSAVFGGA